MISTTRCPASWNSRSLPSTTAWPRWMSGAVGSMPSFTRSGRPSLRGRSAACSASAPSGRLSTAFAGQRRRLPRRPRRCRSASGAMLDSRRRRVPRCRASAAASAVEARALLRVALGSLAPPPPMSADRPPTSPRVRGRAQAAPEAPAASPRSSSPSLLLGLVSFVFGLFVSVASDLPSLTKLLADQGRAELAAARRPRPPDRRAQPAEPRDPHPRADPARSSRRR